MSPYFMPWSTRRPNAIEKRRKFLSRRATFLPGGARLFFVRIWGPLHQLAPDLSFSPPCQPSILLFISFVHSKEKKETASLRPPKDFAIVLDGSTWPPISVVVRSLIGAEATIFCKWISCKGRQRGSKEREKSSWESLICRQSTFKEKKMFGMTFFSEICDSCKLINR